MSENHPFAELRKIRRSDSFQNGGNRGNRVTDTAKPLENNNKPVTPDADSGYPGQQLGVTENPVRGNHYIEQKQILREAVTPVTPVTPLLETAESGSETWTPGDWQPFYDERVAIAEHEHGKSRQVAEAIALECCIVEWLQRHPEPSEPGRCAHCGKAENVGPVILPFGTQEYGHTWLHAECWEVWHGRRRRQARAVLIGAKAMWRL